MSWYNEGMEASIFSVEELNRFPKEALIVLYRQMSESFSVLADQNRVIQEQNAMLIRQVEDLNERVAILTQQRFGRKSEKDVIPGQMEFGLDINGFCVLNEAELITECGIPEETPAEKVIIRKKAGTRNLNLKNIETETVDHDCSAEELREAFPNGYHQLEDEVYRDLKYLPAKFLVTEHHVKVYADGKKFLRGKHPVRLLAHSILTPELAAAVFNAKYVNAVPLNRLSEEFLRHDVNIPRQDMAGWMIRINELYLPPVRALMKKHLMKAHHLHCDESPFTMPEHGKQYMWVYHTAGVNGSPPIFLYEYPGTRGASAPDKFLKGYKGTLVTDGYESYHTLARRHPDELKVAGCWVHAKRKFSDITKAVKKDAVLSPGQKAAAEAVRRIQAIYHADNLFRGSSEQEILDNRQQSVKPLVDAYFAWVKSVLENPGLDKSSSLRTALNYSVNQEKYLRTFLDDALIPMDNNDAERSIRSFCLGKKNWVIIDSVKGAEASAFLYSLAETAKANQLKTYDYFSYLLSELVKFPRCDVPEDVLEKLMPWSDDLPDSCRKTINR